MFQAGLLPSKSSHRVTSVRSRIASAKMADVVVSRPHTPPPIHSATVPHKVVASIFSSLVAAPISTSLCFASWANCPSLMEGGKTTETSWGIRIMETSPSTLAARAHVD